MSTSFREKPITRFGWLEGDVTPESTDRWGLPTAVDAFLNWLDDAKFEQDTQDALDVFMRLPVAKKMPAQLRKDLRAAGWEV